MMPRMRWISLETTSGMTRVRLQTKASGSYSDRRTNCVTRLGANIPRASLQVQLRRSGELVYQWLRHWGPPGSSHGERSHSE